jgi:CRISPR-associated protein Cpf1
MHNLELFTGKYQRQLTLRNALIPVGTTLENLKKHGIITTDEELEQKYQEAKAIIDDYHRHFIDANLSRIALDWQELAEALLAYQHNRNNETTEKLEKVQATYRKQLLKAFSEDENYKHLFKKELFTKVLPSYYTDKEQLAVINAFKNFFTYFSGFNENRANIYSTDPKSTAIGYRLIHENFPKFITDCAIFAVLQQHCPQVITDTETVLRQLAIIEADTELADYFLPNSFNAFLTQEGISKFNNIIGELNKNINLAIL